MRHLRRPMRGTRIFVIALMVFIVLSLLWGCGFMLNKGS
jgi:hypothetical protein